MPRISRRKLVFTICLAAIVAGITIWRMNMSWNTYEGPVVGVMMAGDKESPPTRWYNHIYLALFGWKVVTVFEVQPEHAAAGYSVGYLDYTGKAMVKAEVGHDRLFRMRNGYEDCTFFALGANGKEIPLKVAARSKVDDPMYADAPLH